MSGHQYYEFQAVDRPLDAAAQAHLRSISSRGRITASSFVNSYDWGGLKADPLHLLERHFDLFLYVADWGTRRFAMRMPVRLLDIDLFERFDFDEELVSIQRAGEHVIVDICREETDSEDWEDESIWLPALGQVRADLLAGDLRLLTFLWLLAVDAGWLADEAVEPLPGIGPLGAPLAALADFLCVDSDLLEAATATGGQPVPRQPSPTEIAAFLRTLPEEEKVDLLLRLHADDDPHLGAELRRHCRQALGVHRDSDAPSPPRRTAGELRNQARRIADERIRRAEEQAAKARAQRHSALAQREDAAWREVEELIALRNPKSYDRAGALLADLGELAASRNRRDGFARRVADLAGRHARKGGFLAKLKALSLLPG